MQHVGTNLFTRNFGYTNTNNKLNSITIGANTYNYLYDNTGNLVQENSSRFFQWDAGNNMRCFYNQAGTSEPTIYAQYLYDAAGNRVKKFVRTQGGAYESVSYINSIFNYKTDSTDEQTTNYLMDDTSRIAMIRTGEDFGDMTPSIKYNLEDNLGSSMVLLGANGTVINKEEYYPFGETSFGSYAKKRYRFSGKERDEESGLYYYGARYYCAWLCRFITVDSILKPHRSPYDAFSNNPIARVDPDGKDDYYNADGSYNKEMSAKFNNNGTHNIYVLSADGKTSRLLSDMPLKTDEDKKIVQKIINVYAQKVGVDDVGLASIKSENEYRTTLAITSNNTGKISVNTYGGINSQLSNYHNLMTTIFHESLHKKDIAEGNRYNDRNFTGYFKHAQIYFQEMSYKSFKWTTDDYKKGQIADFSSYIRDAFEQTFNEYDQAEAAKEVNNLVADFNKTIGKEYGYNISISRITGNFNETLGYSVKLSDKINNTTVVIGKNINTK